MSSFAGSSKSAANSPSVSTVLLDRVSTDASDDLSPPVAPFARRFTDTNRSKSSQSLSSDSPYGVASGSRPSSVIDKYDLSQDPRSWGTDLSVDYTEDDDELHRPEEYVKGTSLVEWDGHVLSARGAANLGCMSILILGLVTLFAGYPIITDFARKPLSKNGGFNIGGTNKTGQIPVMPGNFALIDPDTPSDAYTKASWNGGEDMELVFSDEFNVDGRTFYPGDDPYWEAVDLHYWPTNNMEWYDPEAVQTSGGSLVISLSTKAEHNLSYQGGMVSTWNKFCFTGGYIETRAMLPGLNNVMGLWPAVWTMGNLGRAGYGATTDGLWPYSYDACDVGTVANQSINGLPAAATVGGDQDENGLLSFLPGQRLSRCTCSGDSHLHPGPKHSDGTFVGRSAPEIDVFEAQVSGDGLGQVSQSAQWAPFNHGYLWFNTSQNEVIVDPTLSSQNTYIGGVRQQATSVVTTTDQGCYEKTAQCYTLYGFEYKPGFDDAYITWVSDNKVAWTLNVAGMAADPLVNISSRPVPQEPMYIIANLGMSTNFGTVDIAHIPFPVHLFIDYIRVYQPKSSVNIGCNPPGFPTSDYINTYLDAYTNPNYTTWTGAEAAGGFGQTFPKNSLLDQC